MPLPQPRKDENKASFVSRCVSSEVMKEEFKDKKQRIAICNNIYEENKN
ncbi:MAG: hypothetical protein ACOCRK_04790 [bacterium]